ncbi:hypothetical protein [Actinomadura sp. BRA 177]|uniref:hypothetical protein n=1 Tax=Actinomadura sp. BRA 177 TaxID=2745202 RepID=UPI00159554FB|nr:hypothetical protein [Actinomadura sp. BRA 177]NVI93153.1 hypothetical protein [Actinomadura sp. BRA 177]
MFVFNDRDDRHRASDGVSRFGVYLRRYPKLFASWDEDGTVTGDPVAFTAAAWQVATSPVMAPPYVAWTAERLQSVALDSSEIDDALIARVLITVPRPSVLASVAGFGDWDRGDRWNRGYHIPDHDRLSRRPAMLTTTALMFHIPAAELHTPADAPDRLTVVDAKASVKRLAKLLDDRCAPVLVALDGLGVTR